MRTIFTQSTKKRNTEPPTHEAISKNKFTRTYSRSENSVDRQSETCLKPQIVPRMFDGETELTINIEVN